jgi:hypothetical protein
MVENVSSSLGNVETRGGAMGMCCSAYQLVFKQEAQVLSYTHVSLNSLRH